jgi:hypothetical protein
MRIETIISYAVSKPASAEKASCSHAKTLLLSRFKNQYRVLAVINKKMTARVYQADVHVGTWCIPADKSPLVICERGFDVYILDVNGNPYPHPHVGGESGKLCWGSVRQRAEIPFIMTALLNVNLSSAYWRPRYRRLNHQQQQQQ